jgi:hypothetical protein
MIKLKNLLFLFTNISLVLWLVGCAGNIQPLPAEETPIADSYASVTPDASANSGEGIAFDDLGQGFRLTPGQAAPRVILVRTEEERQDLLESIADEHQGALRDIDLGKKSILAVFWGAKPSGGFSITVQNIIIADSVLTIDVLLNENDPKLPRIEASTYPYHLATVDPMTLPEVLATSYRLMSGAEVLATGEIP